MNVRSITLLVTSSLILLGSLLHAQMVQIPPYIQPGSAHDLHHESKIIVWQTDSIKADFIVEFQKGTSFNENTPLHHGKVTKVKLEMNNEVSWLYRAHLEHLEFDAEYVYRVRLENRPISTAAFRTRTLHHKTKFAVFGDCGAGTPGQAAVAYQVHKLNPDFALLTGDNVYSSGLASEYRKRFFNIYMAPMASPTRGAPLMQKIPFYSLVGNHDIRGNDLRVNQDGMAWYYYSDLPLNGPITEHEPEVLGRAHQIAHFRRITEKRFPKMSNYSFRHGNVHVVCIDANTYVNPLDEGLVEWLRNEFKNHKNEWRIVAYHQPGFNSSPAHYNYQIMRMLSPLLEELGVDLVLTGHVHNYQRSLPLKFSPELDKQGKYRSSSEGRVDGQFTLDRKFDGESITKPEGIIYITTGAGGAQLYDAEISNKPKAWEHAPESNWVPFTKKLISDVHSFSWIETNQDTLTLTQIDSEGNTIDRITMTR
jgi:predicted MPP superfamily phosphohydrolase